MVVILVAVYASDLVLSGHVMQHLSLQQSNRNWFISYWMPGW